MKHTCIKEINQVAGINVIAEATHTLAGLKHTCSIKLKHTFAERKLRNA